MRVCGIATVVLFNLGILSDARADCDGWRIVSSPDVSVKGDNTFAAVAGRRTDDVWTVGQFNPDSNLNITLTFAAHYDGANWSAVPSPNVGKQANALHGLAITPMGRVWAVGYYIDDRTFYSRSLIEFWDGAAWRVVDHPADPGVSAVFFSVAVSSANDVWAVGEFQRPLDRFHTLVEHFNGKKWKIVASPDPGDSGNIFYGVTALAGNSVWVVGERNVKYSPDRPLLANWNGESWSVLPPPNDGAVTTRLYGVTADAAGQLRAVGEAENDARRTSALAEIGSQGRRWTIQRVEAAGSSDNHFYGVGAEPNGDAWAVGAYFEPKSGRQFTLTELAQAGDSWKRIPSPSPSRSGDSLLSGVCRDWFGCLGRGRL
jgi:hypothetical protein